MVCWGDCGCDFPWSRDGFQWVASLNDGECTDVFEYLRFDLFDFVVFAYGHFHFFVFSGKCNIGSFLLLHPNLKYAK